MTDQQKLVNRAIARLDRIDGSTDPEGAHGSADNILLDFLAGAGYEDVRDAYVALKNRSKWWGCA
jgi:hypothetical protein